MKKRNKRDCTLIKLYKVISLFYYLSKVIEKLVAERIIQFCETKRLLHQAQRARYKHRSFINVSALMIHKVHKIWDDEQITDVLLMHVKGAFNHIFPAKLVQ